MLDQEDGKKRYMEVVERLVAGLSRCPSRMRRHWRSAMTWRSSRRCAPRLPKAAVEGRTQEDLDLAMKQLVSEAVASPDVINIFAAAGLKSPDVSILSDDFLEDVRHLPQKNLALELLRKLINDDIRARAGRNVVQAPFFADMLEKTIVRYQNRSIDAAQVIAELIDIAKEIRQANQRGEELGLSEEELAFYDALAANESAKQVMGDRNLP